MERLVSAAKKNDAEEMFKAIRNDLAERCQVANQLRDYAQFIYWMFPLFLAYTHIAGFLTETDSSFRAYVL